MGKYARENERILKEVRNAAVKAKLKTAFALMRGAGLIARQSYCCCMGCACAALDSVFEAAPWKIGAVYYHRQDAEGFAYPGPDAGLYIRFGGRPGVGEAEDYRIGEMAVGLLARAGLKPEWNGNPREAIWVPFAGEGLTNSDVQIGGKEESPPEIG